jgi:hypothetical protein
MDQLGRLPFAGCFLIDKLCFPKRDAPAGKGAGPLDSGRAAPYCKGAKLGAFNVNWGFPGGSGRVPSWHRSLSKLVSTTGIDRRNSAWEMASDPALESAAAWAMAPDPAHLMAPGREPAAAPGGSCRAVLLWPEWTGPAGPAGARGPCHSTTAVP